MASSTNKKISLRLSRNGKGNRKTSAKSPNDVFGLLIGKANTLPAALSERKHALMKKQLSPNGTSSTRRTFTPSSTRKTNSIPQPERSQARSIRKTGLSFPIQ